MKRLRCNFWNKYHNPSTIHGFPSKEHYHDGDVCKRCGRVFDYTLKDWVVV